MHKTFIATALALGMCLPVYAEQFSNSNSDSMLSPVTVDEPNTAVPHREKLDTEKQQGLPIRLTGEHAEYDTVSGDFHAEGNIKVSQNGQDIYTTQVKGNMKTGDIWLLEGGKLVEGASETQAACGHYHFNNKTGEMKKLTGKNGKDFLKDKTIAPEPKKVTTYNGDTKKVKAILSGKYGSWNEFYGELYIERIKNKWYAYVSKIKEGEVVKTIKSKTVTDKDNQDEELSYIVIYFGTTGNAEKASGMAITDINVYTATKIEDNKEYNFQEFEAGDILTIDNSVPAVYLNDEERNDLIDVGSAFFSLEPGENYIKIASDDDVPNVDIMWNDKYL